jgi:integral membrane protein
VTLSFLNRIETVRPFTEGEAWGLFRIAALGEAVGWTMLISGILINRYHLPGYSFAIPIAGQVHGTLFIIYFAALLATYSSLRWPRKKFLMAAAAGVIPYGTLVFEQWAARTRKYKHSQEFFCSTVLATVTEEPSVD